MNKLLLQQQMQKRNFKVYGLHFRRLIGPGILFTVNKSNLDNGISTVNLMDEEFNFIYSWMNKCTAEELLHQVDKTIAKVRLGAFDGAMK